MKSMGGCAVCRMYISIFSHIPEWETCLLMTMYMHKDLGRDCNFTILFLYEEIAA